MSTGTAVFRYQLHAVARSRGLLLVGLAILLTTHALLRFSGGGARAMVSLMNAVLLFVPLTSLLLGTTYFYGARGFAELVLAHPVRRTPLFLGLWAGFALPFAATVAAGLAMPALWNAARLSEASAFGRLITAAMLLALGFAAVAGWIAVFIHERAQGLAIAVTLWVCTALVFDAALLGAMAMLGERLTAPLAMMLSLLNPVDAARLSVVLGLGVPSLLGYSGAVFERALGPIATQLACSVALLLWCIVPIVLATRRFATRDF